MEKKVSRKSDSSSSVEEPVDSLSCLEGVEQGAYSLDLSKDNVPNPLVEKHSTLSNTSGIIEDLGDREFSLSGHRAGSGVMESDNETVKGMEEGHSSEEESSEEESSGDKSVADGSKEDKLLKMLELIAMTMKASTKVRKSDRLCSRGRIVDNIKDYKEGTSIQQFIYSLEIELIQAKVRRKDYKWILISKLPPKIKMVCKDLIQSATASYDDIKNRLLLKIGPSLSEVSIKLFVKWKDESRETNRMTRCRQLKELVDRLLLGAKTVEDTKNILMTSLYRIGLTTA